MLAPFVPGQYGSYKYLLYGTITKSTLKVAETAD